MKLQYLIPALFICGVLACSAAKKPIAQKPLANLTFEKPMHDFGELLKGEKRTFIYKFKNTSTEDVVIELVSGCECTTLEAPEGKTFKPGDEGEITATFNSESEEGAVTKTIDILLENVDPTTGYQIIKEVKYKAVVLEKGK